jgi:hypothetical protein
VPFFFLFAAASTPASPEGVEPPILAAQH